MVNNNEFKQIKESIQSGVPAIYLLSEEESRIDKFIKEVADELNFNLREWNLGWGWVDFKNKRPKKLNTEYSIDLSMDLIELQDLELDGQLIVIKNTKTVFEKDPLVIARIQQLLYRIQRHHLARACMIFVNETAYIPLEIAPLVELITIPPPSTNELEEIISKYCKDNKTPISTGLKSQLVSFCTGMGEKSVERALLLAFNKQGEFRQTVLNTVRLAKEQSISKTGVLEVIGISEKIDDIGGLENLKAWLDRKKRIIENLQDAQNNFGITSPKGVLIAGMPGCGKSLTAKATADLFKLPLLRLDIGSLLGKYVGESEANMKKALQIAEGVSPCILWIDELEKAFSGITGNSSGGSEVTTRLFGYFLTWMQEKPATVFVIATANDITMLPPELLRKGRFDEVFSVDFPNPSEREKIFQIFIKKIPKAVLRGNFDLSELSKQTEGFSGADIEGLINEALETAFIQEDNLSQTLLLETIKSVIPLSETLKNKINVYRKTFEQYKLKTASREPLDIKQLLKDAKSNDPSIRVQTAKRDDCPINMLEQLAIDEDLNVRKAVLKNPYCSEKILEDFLKQGIKEKPDFSKMFTWDSHKTESLSDEEFKLVILHPNISDTLLIDFYNQKKIPSSLFLQAMSKKDISKGKISKLFSVSKVKSPIKGVVEKIHCKEHDLVKKRQILLELDDEHKTNRPIKFSYKECKGMVKSILVSKGDEVKKGEVLFEIYLLKNDLKE